MQFLAWPLLLVIKFYRRFISPLLPPSCRYYPSCSAYGLEAIQLHGPFRGTWLTVHRIARCNPWGGEGLDPVPGSEMAKRLAEGHGHDDHPHDDHGHDHHPP